MLSCVFAGSFDPVTKGHMNIIRRAAQIFDTVHVVVMVNINKQETFSAGDRIRMIRKACGDLPNVDTAQWNGLLADYMRDNHEKILIRGLRSGAEFDHEYASAMINRELYGEFETLFIPADPAVSLISSSAVREIAGFGGDISRFVPEEVLKEIQEGLSKRR